MIESFEKVDRSFDSGKNWFQTKESSSSKGLKNFISRIKEMSIIDNLGNVKFEMPVIHDKLNSNLTYCSANSLGFETFERNNIDYSYNIPNDIGISNSNIGYSTTINSQDVLLDGQSLKEKIKELENKIDGLDIICAERADLRSINTRLNIIERDLRDMKQK